jgi:hypothetical protein
MKIFDWDHIFPNGIMEPVKITVENNKVTGVTYHNGNSLERVDYEDVVDSLLDNVDMAGGWQYFYEEYEIQ